MYHTEKCFKCKTFTCTNTLHEKPFFLEDPHLHVDLGLLDTHEPKLNSPNKFRFRLSPLDFNEIFSVVSEMKHVVRRTEKTFPF